MLFRRKQREEEEAARLAEEAAREREAAEAALPPRLDAAEEEPAEAEEAPEAEAAAPEEQTSAESAAFGENDPMRAENLTADLENEAKGADLGEEEGAESGSPEPQSPEEPQAPSEPPKRNFFGRLADRVNEAFMASEIDEDVFDELEEIFITSDIGMKTTMSLMQKVRFAVFDKHIKRTEVAKQLLKDLITEMIDKGDRNKLTAERPLVILLVGINGGGKTTTIGKLGHMFQKEGNSVLLVAGDTFRAAAGEQLAIWADRIGAPLISGQEGQDPSAVLYDGLASAKARGTDVVICDTAGRLQNKKNLMDELAKMNRIIDKQYPEAARETLLVLDATTGKNAISQVEQFGEVTDLSGVIITKLDGTAKGGIAITIADEYDMPIKYIGVGEGVEDLEVFDAKRFAAGIFGEE